MDPSDLSPETFEKAEFTERRRGGYDIDEVERFLEETGTAVAQLLVRYRQLEERATHAEARAAEAEAAARSAEANAATRVEPTPAAPVRSMSEAEEIEKATSTLVMARKTADATIAAAESEAQSLVGEARTTAESMLAEATAEVAAQRRNAAAEIEAELAAGRTRVDTVVAELETRRDSLLALVDTLESRVAGYRLQVAEVATALAALVEDPDALGEQPVVEVPAAAAGRAEQAGVEALATEPNPDPSPEPAPATIDHPTQAYDTVTAEDAVTPWGEGSWSEVAAKDQVIDLGAEVEPISLIDAEPVTGQTSDRFLRELDEAVNEPAEDSNDAMTAFFDTPEEPGRRFGWRR